MDQLPAELFRLILEGCVDLCHGEKNLLLNLRLVNKQFDQVLQKYLFTTIQSDFVTFLKDPRAVQVQWLQRVAPNVKAMYCDMRVTRDEEEINHLQNLFGSISKTKFPEMASLLHDLRRFSMDHTTFEDHDFRRKMDDVLRLTPNLKALKFNLPIQTFLNQGEVATSLLANMLAAFAHRPEGSAKLETLVLNHIRDISIMQINHNPIDLQNGLSVFRHLKHLHLIIKREMTEYDELLSDGLWRLISEASELESLCLTGWMQHTRERPRIDHAEPVSNSIPFVPILDDKALKKLKFLELKKLDIAAADLLTLIDQHAATLKELYINDVYLRLEEHPARWIGHDGSERQSGGDPPMRCAWIADELAAMPLQLDVLRVGKLGYSAHGSDSIPQFDLADTMDPTDSGKEFEERFVEAVTAVRPSAADAARAHWASLSSSSSASSAASPPHPLSISPTRRRSSLILSPSAAASLMYKQKLTYDADTFQRTHNTTSRWNESIDGMFGNRNAAARGVMGRVVGVLERGMEIWGSEIEALRGL